VATSTLTARRRGYASRERFLTELTLDPPDATSDQAGVPLLDEDYLILSTIHSAKGQEWKSVFVLNVVDGCMPSDLGIGTSAEVEEERRLLYVAMTRAKDDLHLVMPPALLHARTARAGRPPRLCLKDAVHSGPAGRIVREDHVAACDCRVRSAGHRPGSAHRRRRPHARDVAVGIRHHKTVEIVSRPAHQPSRLVIIEPTWHPVHMVRFIESRPFANPEAAARKLVEIARNLTCAQGWAYTGVTNTAFLRAGGKHRHRARHSPWDVRD
jgi:hypothetical protein